MAQIARTSQNAWIPLKIFFLIYFIYKVCWINNTFMMEKNT